MKNKLLKAVATSIFGLLIFFSASCGNQNPTSEGGNSIKESVKETSEASPSIQEVSETNPSTQEVSEEKTSVDNKCKVQFIDGTNSNVISTIYVDKGTDASSLSLPQTEKVGSDRVRYTFIGFEPMIEGTISSDISYKLNYEVTEYVLVTFNNKNNKLASYFVEKGTTPSYDGETPTSRNQSYVFSGWEPELAPVHEDTIYEAQFSRAANTYKVRFFDAYNNMIYEVDVKEGESAEFVGDLPTKESQDFVRYAFSGWSSSITYISFDKDVYPIFDEIPFLQVDFEVEGFVETRYFDWGESVIYDKTVTKESDEYFNYIFEGWDPALPETAYQGYIHCTALFRSENRKYKVNIFDKTTGEAIDSYDFSYNVLIPRDTFEKNPNETYRYEIKSIEPSYIEGETLVTGDIDYYVTYEELFIDYEIKYLDHNGDVLDTLTAHYGDPIPTTDKTVDEVYYEDDFKYVFKEWSCDSDVVDGDLIITPVYDKFAKITTYTFKKYGNKTEKVDIYECDDINDYMPDHTAPFFDANSANELVYPCIWKSVDDTTYNEETRSIVFNDRYNYPLNEGKGLFEFTKPDQTSIKIENGCMYYNPLVKRNNYNFDGWYYQTDVNGAKFVDKFNSGSPLSSLPLNYYCIYFYARVVPEQFNIDYELDGGTNNLENPSVYTRESKCYLNEPTRDHSSFDGWYYDSTFEDRLPDENGRQYIDRYVDNIKIYANFITDSYTINFDGNGGYTDDFKYTVYYHILDYTGKEHVYKVEHTEASFDPYSFEAPVFDITKTLICWCIDEELTQPITDSYPLNGDIHLYGKYEPSTLIAKDRTVSNPYSRTSFETYWDGSARFIIPEGGKYSINVSGLLTLGGINNRRVIRIIKIHDGESSDVIFETLSKDEVGEFSYSFIALPGDTIEVRVTTDGNAIESYFSFSIEEAGKILPAQECNTSVTRRVDYSSICDDIPVFTKDNYIFDGWYLDGEDEPFDFSRPFTFMSDIYLTAHWIEIE